ncbi:MAG: glycerate kinase, partial [Methanomassiliicoccales archaeon]|nr:glycerate kinase [Methanomassiliicoccales archaeon]
EKARLLEILEAAVDAIDPYRCVKDALGLKKDVLSVGGKEYLLSRFDRIIVVGAGKASKRMAEAVDEVLGDGISDGTVNFLEEGRVGRITLHKSTHPHPGREGVEGALEIKRLCEAATEKDLVICLISGGGSAMMPCPVDGVTLEEKGRTAQLLMLRGARINELNVVRRHLSCLKGGNLARLAHPATVLSLIVSDVVRDPLESISSGPTAPDPTTSDDALAVLTRFDLIEEVPESVVRHLKSRRNENPKPGDRIFDRVNNVIVASNQIALSAAETKARDLGYNTAIITSSLEGEARDVGRTFSALANGIVRASSPVPPPAVVIAGGETTVTVVGKGKGGRNCELVLSALQDLDERITMLSFGTDGIDGSSEAGGAIGDAKAWKDDAPAFLENNDSASYFDREGGLILTGPTGTNVGDVILVIASRKR